MKVLSKHVFLFYFNYFIKVTIFYVEPPDEKVNNTAQLGYLGLGMAILDRGAGRVW